MSVVGDVENDFLVDGLAVAPGQDDPWRVDSLDDLPVSVNRGFFIAIAIARIARAESLLHGKVRFRRNQNGDSFVSGIDDGDLLRHLAFRNTRTFVQQKN